MAQDVYEVVLHDYHWKTSYRGEYHGLYPTQKEAIRAAVDAAQEAGALNADGAQVKVHGENEQVKVAWTFGRDPYPSKD